MKSQLIAIVAAVLLVGCWPNISIHKAAEEGNIEAVKQHLAADADVNAKNEDGSTPLHSAVAEGHKETAELLIAEGADVNAKNEGGSTPLHYAAKWGHKKIVINNRKAFSYKQLCNLMNVEICLFSKDHDRDTNSTAFNRSAEKIYEPKTPANH